MQNSPDAEGLVSSPNPSPGGVNRRDDKKKKEAASDEKKPKQCRREQWGVEYALTCAMRAVTVNVRPPRFIFLGREGLRSNFRSFPSLFRY